VAFGEALRPDFKAYAASVVDNAATLAEGLAAEGLRPVTAGTDTHLALVDCHGTGVTGVEAERRCAAAGIVLNRSATPYDPEPPGVTSGIRLGTPCVTTQGMGVEEMKEIASLIVQAIRKPGAVTSVAERVRALTTLHPAYPHE
jgi:glycine hydroxymethyltransferase